MVQSRSGRQVEFVAAALFGVGRAVRRCARAAPGWSAVSSWFGVGVAVGAIGRDRQRLARGRFQVVARRRTPTARATRPRATRRFTAFSPRARPCAAAIAARTLAGAVPPKLVRLATEASTLQHVVDAFVDPRIDRLAASSIGSASSADARRPPPRFTARPVMWCASRNGTPGLAHQPVGEIGRGGEAALGQRAHPVGAERRALDHPGHRRDRQREQVVRLEHRRLVVLHVLRIGERQALHRHHQRGHAAR